jgi:hypothetical protein
LSKIVDYYEHEAVVEDKNEDEEEGNQDIFC